MDRLTERAELMGRMLDTIGAMNKIPASIQANMEMRSAALRCVSCRETEACRKWLENHQGGADGPLDKCPNADLFKQWLDN
ncbi:DUF6455 family protein [Roseibium aggregatum]|uniref:DUF6455 domain-containing protein n=1 Tax=Roseibium aggregatum TaxID=187304 RepID=A0A939EB80_9HYPH|nr:DUF6455 family protein [Roseibium aggregatum]MBN9669753.1 hypothetical protein [Roseibium aggregatum]